VGLVAADKKASRRILVYGQKKRYHRAIAGTAQFFYLSNSEKESGIGCSSICSRSVVIETAEDRDGMKDLRGLENYKDKMQSKCKR
jgi:predicted RNA-binding protein with PUA-like domain